MRDYFRQEKLAFRYMPLLYAARIVFAALILVSGNVQWGFMMLWMMFSIGFLYSTEEEYMLPLTEEEIRKRKLCRVFMIWLRYLILGIGGYAMMYVLPTYDAVREIIRIKPLFCLGFFLLQMLMIASMLLDGIIESGKKATAADVVLRTLPRLIYFGYGLTYVSAKKTGLIFAADEWVHVAIMLCAMVLQICNSRRQIRDWKPSDYEPVGGKMKAVEGRV